MGGGIGMGNTCKPMAVLFQCMTKFTTKKKKKNVCLLRIHPFLLCHPFHWHRGFPGDTSRKEPVCQSRRCKT